MTSTEPDRTGPPPTPDALADAPEAPASRTVDFGALSIAYDHRILAPRAWTLLQAQWARELLDDGPPGPVLELCAGAGHIGLAAVHGTERELVYVDADPLACAYAVHNARRAGHGHLIEAHAVAVHDFVTTETFPLIIADPPWVLTDQVPCYPSDPVAAIDGGPDGLRIARDCIATIDRCLRPDGAALLQLGSLTQVARVVDAELPDGLVVVGARGEPGCGVVVKLTRP